MMNRILRLMLVTILVLSGVPLDLPVLKLKEAQAQTTSWLSGYSYRKAIVIDNMQNSSAFTNYQGKQRVPGNPGIRD